MKISSILKKYKRQFSFTLFLLVIEAVLAILFPLFIGYAIDSAINGSHDGAIQLGLLGMLALVVGLGRRVFDSRFYAKLYQSIGVAVIAKMEEKESSKKSARLGMIGELVEFLENALPELISNILGLVGVIGIMASLHLKVFYGSVIVTLIIFLIYGASKAKTIRLNKGANDEFEKQVAIISTNNPSALRLHLQTMMRWNIKLSDLEAINFSISWLVLMSFLVAAILLPVNDGMIKYGSLFSLIMYVFQYIENVINLPFFYQNFLRLQEIKVRLEQF